MGMYQNSGRIYSEMVINNAPMSLFHYFELN